MRGDRLQEIPNIVIGLENFQYFGKLVAEERRSLNRGGHNRRFNCNFKNMQNINTRWFIPLKWITLLLHSFKKVFLLSLKQKFLSV